ncbi:hypothetical protein C0J52_23882 [Blattella germanica]|nr:hypothetical protein C0J52_23882 [Blattella germanica]
MQSSDAKVAPFCRVEEGTLVHVLEFFHRVGLCQLLATGRQVKCCSECSSDFVFSQDD